MPSGPFHPPPTRLRLRRLVGPVVVAVVLLLAGGNMAQAFYHRLPTQLRRLLLGSGPSRVGRLPYPPLPSSVPYGVLPRPRVRGVVLQAIEEGEYVVVKETGRRARVVSKQSNGTCLLIQVC